MNKKRAKEQIGEPLGHMPCKICKAKGYLEGIESEQKRARMLIDTLSMVKNELDKIGADYANELSWDIQKIIDRYEAK